MKARERQQQTARYITVISTDGASQLSRNVSGGLQQTFQLLKDTTGLDAVEMLRNWGGNGTNQHRRRRPKPTPDRLAVSSVQTTFG